MSIFKKIPAIGLEIEAIAKDRHNRSQDFNFRGIDDFYNMLSPLLAKHGVFTVPKVIKESREIRSSKSGGQLNYAILDMEYNFYSEDGSFITARVIGEGMDSGDKASNKAMAIAHKYALMQVFAVPTEDLSDPDYESHETVQKTIPIVKPVQQVAKPKQEPAKPVASPLEANKLDWQAVLTAGKEKCWSLPMSKSYAAACFKIKPGEGIKQLELAQLIATVKEKSFADAMKEIGQPLS